MKNKWKRKESTPSG